ncbi:MAG: helix-turn-helix protein [Firmicutes bacterium]|nr:helix-turn-helix protein [Bacillota bacterium]
MYREFGIALLRYRECKGWSQAKLAELAKLTELSISNYENSKSLPNEKTMYALVKALNAKQLSYHWLRSTDAGREWLPELKRKSLYETYSDIYLGIEDAKFLERRIGRIVSDNKIERHEMLTHRRGQEVFKKIIQAAFAYLAHEKTTPARVAR